MSIFKEKSQVLKKERKEVELKGGAHEEEERWEQESERAKETKYFDVFCCIWLRVEGLGGGIKLGKVRGDG